jgi:exopolysaccharide production protein ExoY
MLNRDDRKTGGDGVQRWRISLKSGLEQTPFDVRQVHLSRRGIAQESHRCLFEPSEFSEVVPMSTDGTVNITATQVSVPPIGGSAKRIFDVAAALAALIALSPLFIGIAALIWLTDGRPIFIRHMRVGHRGKPFPCFKFRTMIVNAQEALAAHLAASPDALAEWQQTQKLRDDPRITRLGAVLRQTSVDELPQLFNILRGHMSFVGPRPIVEAEVEKYGPAIDDYLAARPGLTGLWQISGRSDTTYETRIRFDSDYVRSWSMVRDVAIIVKTVPAVIWAKGTY